MNFRSSFPTTRYQQLQQRNAIRGYDTFDGPENVCLRQQIAGEEYLFLALEFGPRQAVIEWANAILDRHSETSAFVITHSYLYFDDTRVDRNDNHNPRTYGLTDVHNGSELWAELLQQHANVVNVHSGHHIPQHTGTRIDTGTHGNRISQMFVNYQTKENGGQGRLRLLSIDPKSETLFVRTYSPSLDQWWTTPGQQFSASL